MASRLYALPPSEFTAARTAEAGAAKQAGDAALAREIAGLRRPTVSAWAVNRVAREHPDELAELLSLGHELRDAWQAQDAEALAELTRRRAEVTGRLARLIREGGGLSAAAAAEVDQTLDAAVVDAGAAEEVRRGRLVKPLSYSGFAPAPSGSPRPRRRPAGQDDKADEEASARKREEIAARKARERQEAEAAHREWSEALAEAEREHGERAEKVARLEAKLAKARKRLAEAQQRLEVTRREERHARQRLAE
ncbi:hypothetical protein [Nonomuraea sp. LPB2021202275-12-8]|uniref:hypothetical protein n=1 Tax=Nonomuraea sp. LPB2021202275-12-8 TaxID=3120159 RepID=UPI00300CC9A0